MPQCRWELVPSGKDLEKSAMVGNTDFLVLILYTDESIYQLSGLLRRIFSYLMYHLQIKIL